MDYYLETKLGTYLSPRAINQIVLTVLGISANDGGTITVTKELCYYVEICRNGERLWLPYTSLRLAERHRPFYGPKDRAPAPVKTSTVVRKVGT